VSAYLDTSVLVPRLVEEQHSDAVVAFFATNRDELVRPLAPGKHDESLDNSSNERA
jgi:predicted nucleic acid-binding protein